jgi:hypothetical protein
MRRNNWLRAFPIILIICLVIGTVSNLTKSTGLIELAISLGVLAATRLLSGRLNKITPRHMRIIIALAFVLMVIAQLYVLKVMPVTVYHDPFRVLQQADQMATGDMHWRITYFWRYSNNVPLAYLLSLWLRVTWLTGMSTNTSIHLLSMLVLDGFIALLVYTVHQLARRNTLTLAVLAFCTLTPFAYTYYLQVFYSDLPAMLALLIIMREVWRWQSRTRRQKWMHGLLLFVVVLLGQLLKPNLIVVLPAIVLFGLCLLLGKRKLHLAAVVPFLVIILGLGLRFPTAKVIDHAAGFVPQEQFAFPTTNWMVMGLNAKSHGMYSGKDVGNSLKLTSKQARSSADAKLIKKRIQRLGPVGLVRLWAIKVGILLNVHGVQSWYNGGYRSAPSWYLKRARTLQTLTEFGYQVAVITLFILALIRLILWRPQLNSRRQRLALFGVLTALGYIAFHALMWETEQRYGQVLIPLLWIITASLPVPLRQRQSSSLRPLLGLGVLTASLGLGIGVAPFIAAENTQPLIIASQRSQLSTQYHAAPKRLAPGATIAEDVDVNVPANYFSVQTHAHSRVHVELENLRTGDRYSMYSAGVVHRTHQHLTPDLYRIWITNRTDKPQSVDVVATHRYTLNAHPFVLDGTQHAHASLIFTVMRKEH